MAMGILTVLNSTRHGVLMPNKSLPQVSGSQISFVIKVGKYATTDVQVELDTNSAIHDQCPLDYRRENWIQIRRSWGDQARRVPPVLWWPQ
jgi:hypothetical protein